MRRIPQEDDWGCVIASLAMVLDRPYHAVKEELGIAIRRYGEQPSGLNQLHAQALMFRHGYAMVSKTRFDVINNRYHENWPCVAFAPIHLCWVNATAGSHCCAMDGQGRVYDPWSADRLTLSHPDYQSIDHVDGFFRIS